MINLATLLETTAANAPEKTALIFGGRTLTFAQLDAGANRIANALVRAGIGRGDRVAIMQPNAAWFPLAYYGILKAGAIVVPLNVLLKGREIAYHLEDSTARILIAFEAFAEEAKKGFDAVDACEALWIATADPEADPPVSGHRVHALGHLMAKEEATFDTVQTMADDTAIILYTSGTTGQSKGAELTHVNMLMNAKYTGDNITTLSGDDVAIAVLPLFHSFGQTCVLNASIYCGAPVVLIPRFDAAQTLAAMAEHRVTTIAAVPTMYWALLNAPTLDEHLEAVRRHLRICTSGGAAMPVELMRAFEEKFDVTILEGYGLSETSPVASFNISKEERKPGSIGKPIWGTRMRIVDDDDNPVSRGEKGEIVVRGHNVMKGYLGRPDATAEAMRGEWFHTGDIAWEDEDGYFFIVDRKKDMILRGGFNVYPREIEEMLMTHPAVSLVAVVGVPDEKMGEEVKAFIVPKEGADATPEDIMAWCRENMAAYKYPRSIEFRESLPMTATGKVLKRELR